MFSHANFPDAPEGLKMYRVALKGIWLKYILNVNAQQPVPSSSPAKRMKTVSVQVDPVDFHSGLIEMITLNSISFNFFNSHACRATIGPIAKALCIPAYGEAIASSILVIANIIRQKIAHELKRFFCLEIDGAARHNRKIFGINARILQDGKVFTRTL